MKIWQKIKIQKNECVTKEYRLGKFTLLRKVKTPTYKMWNFCGINIRRRNKKIIEYYNLRIFGIFPCLTKNIMVNGVEYTFGGIPVYQKEFKPERNTIKYYVFKIPFLRIVSK